MATARGVADGAANVAVGAAKGVWVGLSIWTFFLVPAMVCTYLVWWIDCHQGEEKMRRKVRKAWPVYEETLVFRFMCVWAAVFIFLLALFGVYEDACRGH